MGDTLEIFGTEYTNVAGFKATDDNSQIKTYINVSDTTAVASDVAQGKYFYLADGTKTEGTATGGGLDDYLAFRLNNSTAAYESNNPTRINEYALRGWTALTSLIVPNVTTIGTQGCYGCSGLTKLFFDNLTSVAASAFYNCTNLKTFVSKKAVSTNASEVFRNCSKLEAFDFGTGSGRLGGYYFQSCSALTIVVLRTTSVTALANISAFTSTPFASGGAGGTLYVPSDLISTYQSASNWSTILGYTNNQIKSIESTHTDPNAPIDLTLYYADGTSIS